ncbi:MAG: MarR family transcriptional regulator [Luteitalea sp.]|nr:MarR family transcriptional regulator [Luteitalea sp.]
MPTRGDGPAPTIGYVVWHLSLRWRVALDRALAPIGLTHAQYALLASLYGLSRKGAHPSQRELADYSGLDAMYVSKLARALQRSDLIERAGNPADPRAVRLTLTKHGVEVVTAAVAIVRRLHDRFLEPLGGRSSQRSAALKKVLETLLRHAESVEPMNRPFVSTSRSAERRVVRGRT